MSNLRRRVLVVAMVLGGCASGEDSTSSSTQSVNIANGAFENGLTTNGVYQNGVYQNGVYQNGVYQNGVYQNSAAENGVYQNGVYQNGVYQNGVYQNGVYQNGVYQNGVYQNGVYQNGVYQNGGWTKGLWSNDVWQVGSNAESMRTNPYTRQFLQYVYACAMPATGFDATLDPNNGALQCNAAGACDDEFYTCASDSNTCVVKLAGSIGVGVNADGTTWAQSGTCDESCQRWVSACVLARTNAYGVKVDISMRAPANAPQAIKDALAVTATERTEYPLREGAYYGNVFATTPATPPPSPTYTGDVTGPIVATPSFFACAGPGSNIPDITKRFCSSQGDQAVIKVPGVCLAVGPSLPVCAGEDTTAGSPTFGAIRDCFTSTARAGLPFKEVITVFLKQPISVCGNEVCEGTEGDLAAPSSCPSDCRTGSWAKAITSNNPGSDTARVSAVDPSDGTTVIASTEDARYNITVDNTVSPPIVLAGNPSVTGLADDVVLIKYAPDGTVAWARRIPELSRQGNSEIAVTIAADHSIFVASENRNRQIWLAKINPDGTLAASWPKIIGAGTSNTKQLSIRFDSNGNLVLAGNYSWMPNSTSSPILTFGTKQLFGSASQSSRAFVVKLAPDTSVVWATDVIDTTTPQATADGFVPFFLAIDGRGDILVPGYNQAHPGVGPSLFKLNGVTGQPAWATGLPDSVFFGSANGVAPGPNEATDPNNPNYVLYVAGSGGLTKLSSDGTKQWGIRSFGGSGQVITPTVDAEGNVIAAGIFWGQNNFGAGLFNAYAATHHAIAAYSPTGRVLWAKHIPTILGMGDTFQLTPNRMQAVVDARGRINLRGGFAGSMQLNGRFLVGTQPQITRGNTFVGSFIAPSPTDTSLLIGTAKDQTGLVVSTIPRPISVEATSAAGAQVFFMPPTALDDGGAGTTVSCSPAPNTSFSIGTTTVRCEATNAIGITAAAQFTVTVRDTLGPTMTAVPADVTSDTAVVTFPLPTATDQVDGPSVVTCSPASGSTFPTGTTLVTCAASDHSSNAVEASFQVTVTRPADTTPPPITVPAPITVAAVDASGAVVSYDASATDDTAVTSFACAPVTNTLFPIGTTTVYCTAGDAAGNTSTASFSVTVADITPPALVVPEPIVAEATGPSGATVVHAASAIDNVDGLIETSCAPASGSTFPVGTTTVTCSASDARGNRSSDSFSVIVRDSTAPSPTVAGDITIEATGPDGAAVVFAIGAYDLVDGERPVICNLPSGATFGFGTTSVTCATSDTAGNTAAVSFNVTVADTMPPVLPTPTVVNAEATDADGATVVYAVSANDLTAGAISPVCFPASGATFPLGTTLVHCFATDNHGNTAVASFPVIVADTTAPSITVPAAITVFATGPTGATATYVTSATDAVDGALATTCSPPSGSVFAIGTTTVTCSATDAHGNHAVRTFAVNVVIAWTGVLQPINADGSSTFKLGSTIPVKFQLSGDSAGITNAVANLTLAKVSSSVIGSDLEAPSTAASDAGNLFRYDPASGNYIFNLSTKGLSAGTWQLTIDLHDGASRTVLISLRK